MSVSVAKQEFRFVYTYLHVPIFHHQWTTLSSFNTYLCLKSLLNRAAMGRARFLLCTGFFFFFRFRVTRRRPPRMMSSSTNQTSADDVFINQSQAKLPLGQMSSPNDVIISQLQAISQLFSLYLPSGKFCLQQCFL